MSWEVDGGREGWAQASLEAKATITVLAPYLAAIHHHQLFFANMRRAVMRRGHPPRRRYPRAAPALAARPLVPAGVQLRLFDRLPRDLRGFDRARHADLANPWLVAAREAGAVRAEVLGWPHQLRLAVDRALIVLLSGLEPGDRVRFSEVAQMRTRHLPVERTAEVLAELGPLDDDRRPRFEDWLQRHLLGLAAGIRRDVEAWLRVLHDGAPRSKPRSPEAVWSYCAGARPALLEWSTRYQHLREVTRDDVRGALDLLHGQQRARAHVALRSLFGFCKRRGLLFGDPTSRIRLTRPPARVLLPLDQAHLDEAVAAATTPEERLVLALAAVHAARRVDICALTLDDVDLGNRRLVINGRSRRLDDLTRQALLDYLAYRRARWPSTANPHRSSAGTPPTRPVRSAPAGSAGCFAALPPPLGGCASTGNSRSSSCKDPIRSTCRRYSASARRRGSATPLLPARSLSLRPSARRLRRRSRDAPPIQLDDPGHRPCQPATRLHRRRRPTQAGRLGRAAGPPGQRALLRRLQAPRPPTSPATP